MGADLTGVIECCLRSSILPPFCPVEPDCVVQASRAHLVPSARNRTVRAWQLRGGCRHPMWWATSTPACCSFATLSPSSATCERCRPGVSARRPSLMPSTAAARRRTMAGMLSASSGAVLAWLPRHLAKRTISNSRYGRHAPQEIDLLADSACNQSNFFFRVSAPDTESNRRIGAVVITRQCNQDVARFYFR